MRSTTLGVEAVLDALGSIPGEEGRKSTITLVPKIGTVNANESARGTEKENGKEKESANANGSVQGVRRVRP